MHPSLASPEHSSLRSCAKVVTGGVSGSDQQALNPAGHGLLRGHHNARQLHQGALSQRHEDPAQPLENATEEAKEEPRPGVGLISGSAWQHS